MRIAILVAAIPALAQALEVHIELDNPLTIQPGPHQQAIVGYGYSGLRIPSYSEPGNATLKAWLAGASSGVKVSWEQLAGPGKLVFHGGEQSRSGANVTVAASIPGNYTVAVRAEDGTATATAQGAIVAWIDLEASEERPMFPFVPVWNGTTGEAVATPWLRAGGARTGAAQPTERAGAGGRPVANATDAGKLWLNGRRFRFLGVDLAGSALFPMAEADARGLARRLRRSGFNFARLIKEDSSWPTSPARGLSVFVTNGTTSSTLNATNVDVVLRTAEALVQEGVYLQVNLHAVRTFMINLMFANGTIAPEPWRGLTKFDHGVTAFFPPFLELQKEYARKFLTARRAGSNFTLASDPGVLAIETTNEDSLLVEWCRGTLDEPLVDVPAVGEALRAGWASAVQRTGLPVAAGCAAPSARPCILLRGNFSSEERAEVRAAWLNHVWDTEVEYYRTMKAVIVNELGFTGLVVGTSSQNSPALLLREAGMDAVDLHGYWSMSSGKQGPGGIVPTPSVPQSGVMWGGVVPLAPGYRVRGLPFWMSEFNQDDPSGYAAETCLVAAAIAAAQDLDGMALWAMWVLPNDERTSLPHSGYDGSSVSLALQVAENPVKSLGCLAASAALVRGAGEDSGFSSSAGVSLALSKAMWLNKTLADLASSSAGWPDVSQLSAADFGVPTDQGTKSYVELVPAQTGDWSSQAHTTSNANVAREPGGRSPLLTWGDGAMAWKGSAAKLFSGFVQAGRSIELGDAVSVTFGADPSQPLPSQGWAAATVHTLGGAALQDGRWQGDTLVITLSGTWANTNMTWGNAARTYVSANGRPGGPQASGVGGTAPVLVEGVAAMLTLPLAPGTKARPTPLAPDGTPQAPPGPWRTSDNNGTLTVRLDGCHDRTLWWSIECDN